MTSAESKTRRICGVPSLKDNTARQNVPMVQITNTNEVHQQFVTRSEMRLVTAKVSEISVQVAGIVDWKKQKK